MTGDDDFRPERFRAGRRSRFKTTCTPQWALLMQALSDAGYRAYSLMCAHVSSTREDTEVWPHQKTLAEMLGKRPEAVSRVINKELVPLGLVEVETERYGRNRTLRRNVYTVHEEPPPGWEGVASLQEWYAALKQESAAQPGDAKNRASGDAKNRVKKKTKVDLDEREATGGSVRPSVRVEEPRVSETEGRTDGGEGAHQDQDAPGAGAVVGPAAAGAAPDNSGSNEGEGARPAPGPVDPSPGVLVLRAVAAECPEWTINHADSLRDQGRVATGMLESGFTAQEIRHALVSRPLPQPMTHTVAAVVGRRLKDLLAAGPAGDIALIPAQTGRAQHDAADDVPSVTLPDSYAVKQAKLAADVAGHGKLRNCQGDDGLCDQLAAPGSDLCGRCQNGGEQPRCAGGCGRKVVAPGARCIPCTDVPTPAAEVGDCPGWDGKPCGRAVLTAGLCRTCKFESEKAKRNADAEWEAARTAAVEAATAAEAPA
ncbi:hypothetical protein ACIOWI_35815 [Streptomyces sp. NPDC087659]|uniref:hypothetical protein n=1 Tax=Streptomyces sp. NPDC087659 TaxID=3365801 RepID=UPI00382BCAD2